LLELSLHLLDVVQNSIEAGASRIEIKINEDLKADQLLIEVGDNGRGMSKDQVAKVLDPFYTTRKTRHVGLGVPLLLETCRRCEGDLKIFSQPGKGTTVQATFRHSHIDRPPLGDIPSILITVLLAENPVDWLYIHRINEEAFQLDSSEIRKELEDVPLTHPKVRKWLLDYLKEGEKSLSLEASSKKTTP
jgi:Histidine kinase-, DNA gyrase B-, and HSP90-like ATPase